MPSTTSLAELPARWLTAIRDHVAAKPAARPERHIDPATSGEQITAAHADATVEKATRALYHLHPSGGEFRNALFGLAAVVSRRAAALGQSGDTATADTLALLTEHPAGLTPNADDKRWISEGVARGCASPWRIVAPCRGVNPTAPAAPMTSVHPATAEELDRFLARCTRYRAPGRLGQRTAWMHADGAGELPRHTLALIDEAARGLYPAARALRALRHIFGQPPGTDPAGADLAFARALGAFLDHKGAAA
jgi:hypothetical protein